MFSNSFDCQACTFDVLDVPYDFEGNPSTRFKALFLLQGTTLFWQLCDAAQPQGLSGMLNPRYIVDEPNE